MNYLYRKIEDFGVGHLCSVQWDPSKNSIWTEFMPECDVPDVDTKPQKVITENGIQELEDRIPDIKYLEFYTLSSFSKESDADIINGLNSFVDAYNDWIKEQVDSEYPDCARKVQEACHFDYIRMKKNIDKSIVR